MRPKPPKARTRFYCYYYHLIVVLGWQTGINTALGISSGSGTDLDLRKIGQARNQLMDMKIQQVCGILHSLDSGQ